MLKSIFLTITMFVGSFMSADDDFQPTIVPHTPQAVYLASGFDSNDNAQVVFEGYYANTCYRKGLTSFEVDKQNKVIYIMDMAHFYDQQFCAEIIIPYVKTLDIGVLEPGNYPVMFKNDGGSFDHMGTLPVKKAVNGMPDDYLYANVEDATFTKSQPNMNIPPMVALKGRHHSTCLRMDRVEVNHATGSNVIEILPITKIEGADCEIADPPQEFTQKVALDGYAKGRYLLHIRSLNGQSLNRLVHLK